MKKALAILLAMLMMLSMLTACAGQDTANAPAKTDDSVNSADTSADKPADNSEANADLEAITVSVHPSGHGLPAYVAEQLGYYTEEGLDVTTRVYIGAPPQMEAYEAGAWDIGTTGFGGIVLGVAKSTLKVVGVTIDDGLVMGLWARSDSDLANAGYNEETGCYGTADDWRGKEILYTQGTITDIMLTATLEKLGLTADEVVRTNMDSSPAFTAFKAGSGDMVQANSAFYFNAQNEGWVPVTTGTSQNIYMPSVIVASDKIIESNPEVVEKWVRAYMKGVEWIKANPEEAAKMFVEFCDENGVATDETNALDFVNAQVINIPGVDEQLSYFATAEDGNGTVLQEALAHCMNTYVSMGNYTQQDADALMLDENYDSSFMEKLK